MYSSPICSKARRTDSSDNRLPHLVQVSSLGACAIEAPSVVRVCPYAERGPICLHDLPTALIAQITAACLRVGRPLLVAPVQLFDLGVALLTLALGVPPGLIQQRVEVGQDHAGGPDITAK